MAATPGGGLAPWLLYDGPRARSSKAYCRTDEERMTGWEDNLFTADTLRQRRFEKPVPLVAEMLFSGEIGVLAGSPKMGKSLLCAQLAEALVTGGDFLGYRAEKCRVLYLDLENRPVHV